MLDLLNLLLDLLNLAVNRNLRNLGIGIKGRRGVVHFLGEKKKKREQRKNEKGGMEYIYILKKKKKKKGERERRYDRKVMNFLDSLTIIVCPFSHSLCILSYRLLHYHLPLHFLFFSFSLFFSLYFIIIVLSFKKNSSYINYKDPLMKIYHIIKYKEVNLGNNMFLISCHEI